MKGSVVVARGACNTYIGLALGTNVGGLLVKILTLEGRVFWASKEQCEVLSEGR